LISICAAAAQDSGSESSSFLDILPVDSAQYYTPNLSASNLTVSLDGRVIKRPYRVNRLRANHGSVIILLDAFDTNTNDLQPVKSAVKHWLKNGNLHSDRLSIYSYGASFYVIEERGQMRSSVYIQNALHNYDRRPILNPRDLKYQRERNDLDGHFQVLQSIAAHESGWPEPKILILIASGFPWFRGIPPEDSELYPYFLGFAVAAENANMRVYAVDCDDTAAPAKAMALNGRAQHLGGTAEISMSESWGPSGNPFSRGVMHRPIESLTWLTNLTGGRFYSGHDKLPDAMEDAFRDLDSTLRLEWKNDSRSRAPVSSINVETARPKIQVKFRRFQVNSPIELGLSNRLRVMEGVLTTPLDSTGIPFAAEVNSGRGELSLVLDFDGRAVHFTTANGISRGILDVICALFDENGKRLPGGKRDEMQLKLTASKRQNFEMRRHRIEQRLPVPSGARQLRIIMRDAVSGNIGSRTLPLP
jgi:hypothetical protein